MMIRSPSRSPAVTVAGVQPVAELTSVAVPFCESASSAAWTVTAWKTSQSSAVKVSVTPDSSVRSMSPPVCTVVTVTGDDGRPASRTPYVAVEFSETLVVKLASWTRRSSSSSVAVEVAQREPGLGVERGGRLDRSRHQSAPIGRAGPVPNTWSIRRCSDSA